MANEPFKLNENEHGKTGQRIGVYWTKKKIINLAMENNL
jgi:hypothetical protein